MKNNRKKLLSTVIAVVMVLASFSLIACFTQDNVGKSDDFQLVSGSRAAVILVDGADRRGSTDGEYPGVVRAAYDLQTDVKSVSGVAPIVVQAINGYVENAVIIGTLGKSKSIDKIVENGKIDVTAIEGGWEQYVIQTVSNPFNDGRVKNALVIAGSDKRGSIYGIYSVSELIGVSPWYYFADSPALEQKATLSIASDYKAVGVEPDVKYRGVFINDEESLERWARALDEGAHLGPNFYEKIFEVLLRMKANYLWPGMHACSDAFNDYIDNPANADYYGIVIGTSHCDMLLRNNLNEWSNFVTAYKQETGYTGDIIYDYTISEENTAIIQEYWRRSVMANKDYEVQWTLGMRGAHDDPFEAVNINKAPWNGDKCALMEQVIDDQREILKEALGNPTLDNVFMMFIPYKEVQQIYNSGLNVPDDITIMWADDNHGFIRNLPNEIERERSGGHGIYYHNSYWGPDNESYMWINSMPLTMMYEEMNKAYRNGVQTAWILNAGDFVPNLTEIEFFVSLGYDMDVYTNENVYEQFIGYVAEREYGAEFADDLVTIWKSYTQLTNSRKLEQMSVDLFSAYYGDESEQRIAAYKELYDLAESVYNRIPEHKRDCFYETTLFEVRNAYFINAEFYYAHKGNVAYSQERNATAYNCYLHSKEFNQMRKDEISYYDTILSDGKWKNMMDPETYPSPVMSGFANGSPTFVVGAAEAGFIAEGEAVESADSKLSFGNYAQGSKYVDVFNKGGESFDFAVSSNVDFIKVSQQSGTVTDETRVWVAIDWSKVSASTTGELTVTACGDTKTIDIEVIVADYNVGEKTYVEQDGYVSIEAEHYSSSFDSSVASWSVIKDLGRTSGDMVRAETQTLVGYNERSFEREAPYLEYTVYFTSEGTFNAELYRLPTLSSLGRVRLAVGINDSRPVIIEGEKDYGTNNPAWEEGIFTQIIKHKFTLTVKEGLNTIRLYMIDPFITVDKLVVYTADVLPSYFGPSESYNSTFNSNPFDKISYKPYYESKYTLPTSYDVAQNYGNGYFVEQNGKLSIEAEAAALGGDGAYVTHDADGRWKVARTIDGVSMRTDDRRDDFDGRWETEAPTLNYDFIINTAGTYNVWFKMQSPNPRSSAYAFGIDGSFKFVGLAYGYNREEVFLWYSATQVTLTAGVHTLNYYCSQDGISIDKIYLTRTGETPDDSTFRQSARTTIWNGSNATAVADDAALKFGLLNAISSVGNYYNVVSGSGLGEYGAQETAALTNAINAAYALINSSTALDDQAVAAAIAEIATAKTNLTASRNMTDEEKQYLLYETFDKMWTGLEPFGYEKQTYLAPDVAVAENADGEKFLNIRTFNEQGKTERALINYDFAPQKDTLTVEARMSFNEGEWGSFYLQDEFGVNAVCLAFEYAYNRFNLVAYNNGAKTVIASYERNVPVDIRIEANVAESTFDVFVNGEKVADGFAFRNAVDSISSVTLGCATRNADMRLYSLKAN